MGQEPGLEDTVIGQGGTEEGQSSGDVLKIGFFVLFWQGKEGISYSSIWNSTWIWYFEMYIQSPTLLYHLSQASFTRD